MVRRAWESLTAVVVWALSASAASGGVLSGVPDYPWYHGCSPTSGGMIVGYWDGLPGYGDLFDGDASVATPNVLDMIASPQHISDPHQLHHSANCIADFMRTSENGTTGYDDIGPGLEDYIEWDNPNTPIDEGYEAEVATHNLASLIPGGDFDFDMYEDEIDAGRPVLMNILIWYQGQLLGHTVVGYGYDESVTFEISMLDGDEQVNLTVPGFAVHDTWPEELDQHSWWGWDRDPNAPVNPHIDENGVEWWPWVEPGYAPEVPMLEWYIYQGITVDIIPEPTSAALMAASLLGLTCVRKRRRRSSNP